MKILSDKILEHLRNICDLPEFPDGSYTCLERLATGGMGTVYLAEDTKLRRKVALKVLNIFDQDGLMAERMLQEAEVIAKLEHPGIVPIHDVGALSDGRPFYTMKYVKGHRLDEKIAESNSLSEILRIFRKVCEAVAFAHSYNIIHRDLKPENIMVGDFGEALVMDWGLAKVLESDLEKMSRPKYKQNQDTQPASDTKNLTEHGAIIGTPHYMAPEQQKGDIDEIDRRTDIYALGAILQFILERCTTKSESGVYASLPSFRKNKFQKHSKRLQAIADKAMSGNKSDRYDDALLLRNDVENYLNSQMVSAYNENIFEKMTRWLKQNKFLILLILAYVLARAVFVLLRNL